MPVRRLRASVRSACVARVSCRSLRSSLVRFASAVAPLLFFFSRCAFSRCLLGGGDVIPSGVIAPSRFSCLPPLVRGGLRFASCLRACPSSVISHPLSVIRLMWLVVPSCGGFHCPLSACLPVSSARCWYMPVMLRYVPRPVLACRGAGRVMAVAVVVSLVGDLFVLLRGRRLVRSVSLRGG